MERSKYTQRILIMNNLNYRDVYLNYLKVFECIIKSNNFLRPNNALPLDRFHIINDCQKANTLYTMEYPLEELGEEGSQYDVYVDLMNERTDLHYGFFDNFTDADYLNHLDSEGKFSEKVFSIVVEAEQKNLYFPEEYTDFVLNHILSYISYLTFSNIADKLLDLEIEAYTNGAMPCGWYGKYPEGKLAVYVPLSD